jgi:hypothetical protein
MPKELQRGAFEVQVTGARAGIYFLIPYNGKLKRYTDKKVVGMFIPQFRSGKERLVSVVVEDNLIFISKDSFKTYEAGLRDSAGIELRKTYFS